MRVTSNDVAPSDRVFDDGMSSIGMGSVDEFHGDGALPSVGEPSWFASPISVRRRRDGLTIQFRIPEAATELRAESTGASAVLTARLPAKHGWRPHRGTRNFALPFDAPRGPLRVVRNGPVGQLFIRLGTPKSATNTMGAP